MRTMTAIVVALFLVNLGCVMFFPSGAGLDRSITEPVARSVPAIACPVETYYDYRKSGNEDSQGKIFNRTVHIYRVYSFTLIYGTIAGGLFLLWWLWRLRQLVKDNYPITLPSLAIRRKGFWTLLAVGTAILGVFVVYPFIEITYEGSCKVAMREGFGARRLGAFSYIVMFWAEMLFLSVALYIYTVCYLHKKGNV